MAEDLEGNLSSWFGGSPDPRRRTVYVGPPAVVAWETPHADDRVAGSVEDGLLLGWSASVPATVPDTPVGPFIKRVEILADGQPWYDMPYDKGVPWNSFTSGKKLREAAYNHWVLKQRKAARGSQWTLLTTRTSDSYGRVKGRFVRRASGYYRLASPGVLGKIGPSRSAALKVTVRP